MAMSLASIKKGVDRKPAFSVFYGPAGVGKTALAASFPEPVFMRTLGEDFPSDVEDPNQFPEAKTFDDVTEAIAVLATDDHPFQTFAVDAVDGLESLVFAEACRRNGWKTIEEPGYGKGYAATSEPWRELLEGLTVLRTERRMNVVLLGHTEIVRFDSPTTDPYSRYKVNLHKRGLDLIGSAADLVGFVNYRVTLKEANVGGDRKVKHGEGGGNRVIYVEERPGYIAKNRYGMPASIDYKKGEGYSALAKYLPASGN